MRLRNNPDALDLAHNHPNFIHEPDRLRGKWNEYFKNSNPLHIEIGSGKGKFITSLAVQHPDINYIALEKFTSVLVKLIKKIPEGGLYNLAIMDSDAENLSQFFKSGELSRIYLNFSDPWPKKRHAKRRLTHIRFLTIYKSLLKDDGLIALKTDNMDFFDFSTEQFMLTGYHLGNITRDLHKSPFPDGNVTTEYEEKFINQGLPICSLNAYKSNI